MRTPSLSFLCLVPSPEAKTPYIAGSTVRLLCGLLAATYNKLPPPILRVLPILMSITGSVGEELEQVGWETGILFDNELRWRDQYHEIENHGYRLRPRYHPEWKPSWIRSGKPFFTTEDGQPTLVSVASVRRSPLITLSFSCQPRWMQRASGMGNKSCSRGFLRQGNSRLVS